jgi:membrane-bound lytic murein transglycosylase B
VALIEEAVDRGFERGFVEEALHDVEPAPRIVELDRLQADTPPDLQLYLAQRLTPALVARGREMMTRYRLVLEQIEDAFGVDRQFLVAIWGAETGFGGYTGNVPVLQALATLAWEPRRSTYFRAELFDALRILRAGHIDRHAMTGSWAGAMGQPQFMPSSYLRYAIDFDHDGRRDIWTSVADTLASIANYLRRFGWQPALEWGREVIIAPAGRSRVEREVPRRTGGCAALRALTQRRPMSEWSVHDVVQRGGSELPPSSIEASLLVLDMRSFLVYRNYETILAYNCSHRYALSVAMLADLLR